MPETYWTFEKLGVLDKLQREPVQQEGRRAVRRRHRPRVEAVLLPQPPRPRLKRLVARRAGRLRPDAASSNAADHGAECIDQTRVVLEVLFEGDRADRRAPEDREKPRHSTSASRVVDRRHRPVVAHRESSLGLKQMNPDLRKAGHLAPLPGRRARRVGRRREDDHLAHTRDKKRVVLVHPPVGRRREHRLRGRRRLPAEGPRLGRPRCSKKSWRSAKAFEQTARRARSRWTTWRSRRSFSYTTRPSRRRRLDARRRRVGLYRPGLLVRRLLRDEVGRHGERVRRRRACNSGDCVGPSALAVWSEEFKAGTKWVRKLVHAFYSGRVPRRPVREGVPAPRRPAYGPLGGQDVQPRHAGLVRRP